MGNGICQVAICEVFLDEPRETPPRGWVRRGLGIVVVLPMYYNCIAEWLLAGRLLVGEDKTLKEWRELRGLSREELADKSDVDLEDIARWEEVGFPTYFSSRQGDALSQSFVGPLMEAPNAKEGVAATDAPVEAEPGAYVLDLAKLGELDSGVVEFLREHAEEIGLRMAVPNRWDVALQPFENLEPEDVQVVIGYGEAEAAHARKMGVLCSDIAALMSEHASSPDQAVSDVLEERGGRLAPKRGRLGEGQETVT
jgi:hypothetical protein